jgi:hypothetical protein
MTPAMDRFGHRFGHDPLIDDLLADLTPVRPVRRWHGWVLIAGATLLLGLAVSLLLGMRSDLAELRPSSVVVLRSTALLLIGLATASAATAAIHPGVGQRHTSWAWALAVAALIPLASIALVLRDDVSPSEVLTRSAIWCLGVSLSGAAVIGTVLTVWLRRGAVTEPRLTGMLVGLSAGAFGTFAYNIYCPSSSIHYAALWYSLCVMISAVAGRVFLPRLLRW